MNFIKKRLFLIVSMLLILVAGSLFLYGKTVEKKNATNNQTVLTKYNQIQSISREGVHNNVLKKLKTLAILANQDMEEVKKKAKQTTARPFLNPDIFPEPKGQNPLIKYQKFAYAYCRSVDDFLQKLGAGVPPSPIEERRLREKILNRPANTTRTSSFGSRRSPSFGLGSSQGPRTDEQIEIDELRKQRAQNISIYSDTTSFFAYDFWENPQPDEKNALLHDTWFSQLACWIQEDVVLAIQKINENSKSVPTSPIKRLIEISFQGTSVGTSGYSDRRATYRASASPGSRLASATTNLGAARRIGGNVEFLPGYLLPPDPSVNTGMTGGVKNIGQIADSWTQRISGGLVDVVQFEVALVIDTMKIDAFLNALQSEKYTEIIQNNSSKTTKHNRNQITVLQIMIEPLEIDLEKQSGFYYGPGSLGVLRLVGEYVFFKSGYETNMPIPVKDMLNPPEQPQTSRRSMGF